MELKHLYRKTGSTATSRFCEDDSLRIARNRPGLLYFFCPSSWHLRANLMEAAPNTCMFLLHTLQHTHQIEEM